MSDDVYKLIQDGYFTNTVPYPSKPKMPAVLRTAPMDLSDSEIGDLSKYKKGYKDALAAESVARKAYHAEEARINDEFRTKAIDFVGLSDYKLVDKVFAYAYENGHSDGFRGVLTILDEVAALIL